MNELIKLVQERTGVSEEQAQQAVETVMDFLKDRLPEPLGGQLENLVEGGDISDQLNDLLGGGLGGLFGKK